MEALQRHHRTGRRGQRGVLDERDRRAVLRVHSQSGEAGERLEDGPQLVLGDPGAEVGDEQRRAALQRGGILGVQTGERRLEEGGILVVAAVRRENSGQGKGLAAEAV